MAIYQPFNATGGLAPNLLYTDTDPAMIATVSTSWPKTKHHFCLFHIRKNLEKHFMSKYGDDKWRKFFSAFCYVRNSCVESIFEERWAALLNEYEDAANYMHRYLYQCQEAWALCFTHYVFNAGYKVHNMLSLIIELLKTILTRIYRFWSLNMQLKI